MNNEIKAIPVGTRALTPEETHLCQDNSYHSPVVIDNQLCALHIFFATVGIVVGITDTGYQRRYCFQEFQDAARALAMWARHPHREHPGMSWIKLKGVFNSQAVNCRPEDVPTKYPDIPTSGLPTNGGVRTGELALVVASESTAMSRVRK